MRLIAIDPGLANTAAVLWDGRFLSAKTFTTKGDAFKTDWHEAIERGKRQAENVLSLSEWGRVDVVVCESYIDIPGKFRQAANRWTTPLAIGLMIPAIEELCPVVMWQSAETVMKAYRPLKDLWKAKHFGVIDGDDILTNDHLRSAACHALFAGGPR